MTKTDSSAFVLVGPTASGKSAVVQYLAEQNGTPVVSADSMNIYCGMDIGTAKPSVQERGPVEYFGVDLVKPVQPFSAGAWLQAVKPAFKNGSVPMVAGGTGLYVKCLLAGLDKLPAADPNLRERAEKMTIADLQAEARSFAPEAYAALADKENPRRLVRLLEHGVVPGRQKKELPAVTGLYVERHVLVERIVRRVDKMYAAGLLEEAESLMDLDLSATARKAIGYAEAFAVLRGGMTQEEAKERTVIRTRRLAKRQMTWFRTQLNVRWIDTAGFPETEKLAEEAGRVWEKVPVVF